MAVSLSCLRIWLLISSFIILIIGIVNISICLRLWIFALSNYDNLLGVLIIVPVGLTMIFGLFTLGSATCGGLAATYKDRINCNVGCFIYTCICLFTCYFLAGIAALVAGNRNGYQALTDAGVINIVFSIFYLHNTILACIICYRQDKYQLWDYEFANGNTHQGGQIFSPHQQYPQQIPQQYPNQYPQQYGQQYPQQYGQQYPQHYPPQQNSGGFLNNTQPQTFSVQHPQPGYNPNDYVQPGQAFVGQPVTTPMNLNTDK
jgi:hypothetical protein